MADVLQAATGQTVELAVVRLPEADGPKRGFVLLPKLWVVKRAFAWVSRFRRLARDYERLAATLASLHFLAISCLMLHRFTALTTHIILVRIEQGHDCRSQSLDHTGMFQRVRRK